MSFVVMPRRMTYSAAMESLEGDFIRAIYRDVQTKIDTPAWPKPQARVVDVIHDEIAGATDTALLSMLQIVVKAAQGQEVKKEAEQWIAAQARRFAEYHADDMCAENSDE